MCILQGNESFLEVREGGQNRSTISLQVLKLQALGLMQLALDNESVEQGLGQSGVRRCQLRFGLRMSGR